MIECSATNEASRQTTQLAARRCPPGNHRAHKSRVARSWSCLFLEPAPERACHPRVASGGLAHTFTGREMRRRDIPHNCAGLSRRSLPQTPRTPHRRSGLPSDLPFAADCLLFMAQAWGPDHSVARFPSQVSSELSQNGAGDYYGTTICW
jgi:hypothetical protein